GLIADGRSADSPSIGPDFGEAIPRAVGDPFAFPRAQRHQHRRHLPTVWRRCIDAQVQRDQCRAGVTEPFDQLTQVDDGMAQTPQIADDNALGLTVGNAPERVAQPRAIEDPNVLTVANDLEELPAEALTGPDDVR